MKIIGSRPAKDRSEVKLRDDNGVGVTDSSQRGVKRHAHQSNLSDDQRFTKRFNLLTLDAPPHSSSHAYIPLQAGEPATVSSYTSANPSHARVKDAAAMDVDDTKDRIFIGDLDAEIADIDAHQPEERLIFLPDIEKHFSKLPRQVLAGSAKERASLTPADQQLVLYSVPQSLTASSRNDDAVRKAILETRHRAQDRAQELAREKDLKRKYASTDDGEHAVETAHGYNAGYTNDEQDVDADAMDIE